MSDKKTPTPWPLNDEFYVEVEDHCEDGSWSGYAHSDEYPRSQDTKRAILLSKHTHLLAEAVAKAEREAKYGFIKSVLEEAERLSDKYQPEPAVMAAFFEVAGPIVDGVLAAKKASELRKGATPENGGKDEG